MKNDDVFNDVPNDVLVLSNDDDEDLSDDNEAASQRFTIIPMSILETSQNPRTMVNDHIPSNKTVPSTSRMSTPYYSRENEQLRNDYFPSNWSAPPASRMRTTSPYPRENSQFRNDYISRMTTLYSRGNGQLQSDFNPSNTTPLTSRTMSRENSQIDYRPTESRNKFSFSNRTLKMATV